MIRIKIEGDPRPAARPRFACGRAYQPKCNVDYRREIQSSARLAMRGKAPMTGAISAVVRIYRKSRPTARNFGDVDNHLKAILDGLNGVAFLDDSQIVRCVVEKNTDKKLRE